MRKIGLVSERFPFNELNSFDGGFFFSMISFLFTKISKWKKKFYRGRMTWSIAFICFWFFLKQKNPISDSTFSSWFLFFLYFLEINFINFLLLPIIICIFIHEKLEKDLFVKIHLDIITHTTTLTTWKTCILC